MTRNTEQRLADAVAALAWFAQHGQVLQSLVDLHGPHHLATPLQQAIARAREIAPPEDQARDDGDHEDPT